MRNSILYIAISLDGYIAKPNDDLGFLSLVEKKGEDYGYWNFIKTVDTIVVGRKTYDWVIKEVGYFPDSHIQCFVLTRTAKESVNNITFFEGKPRDLVSNLKLKSGKNIFIQGGAQIVNDLLKHHLIDEFIISIIPVLVGDGIKLFADNRPEELLKLKEIKSLDTGSCRHNLNLIGIDNSFSAGAVFLSYRSFQRNSYNFHIGVWMCSETFSAFNSVIV